MQAWPAPACGPMRSINPQQSHSPANGSLVRSARPGELLTKPDSRRQRLIPVVCTALSTLSATSSVQPAFAQSAPEATERTAATDHDESDIRPLDGEANEAHWLGDPGFEGSIRSGFGLPVGSAARGRSQSAISPWRVPLWFDVNYRLKPALSFGAYAQLLLGATGDSCLGNCNWEATRLGLQAQWSLDTRQSHRTWVGLALGYEWLTQRDNFVLPGAPSEGDQSATNAVAVLALERLSGPEAILQGGWDYALGQALSLGPYLAASLGRYSGDSFTCTPSSACSTEGQPDGATLHGWISIGLRASYFP